MSRLQQLVSRCKCSVEVEFNAHKDDYATVAQFLAERESNLILQSGYILPEVRKVMEATDTMVEVTVYPDTPVGSYTVYHYDLEGAVTQILEALGEPINDETHELAIAINTIDEHAARIKELEATLVLTLRDRFGGLAPPDAEYYSIRDSEFLKVIGGVIHAHGSHAWVQFGYPGNSDRVNSHEYIKLK